MDWRTLTELIQADLDGALSPAEKADLSRRLLQDPDARRLQEEFRQLDRLLRDIPKAEPPPGLRAAILENSAGVAHGAARQPVTSHRSRFQIAAAVLGGLLIVGLAYLLLDSGAPRSGLQGSVVAMPHDRVVLRGEGVELIALLGRRGEKLGLDIELHASRSGAVVATFDPAEATFVRALDAAPSNSEDGQVTVEFGAGTRRLALEFSGDGPIRLEVRAGDRVVGMGVLNTN